MSTPDPIITTSISQNNFVSAAFLVSSDIAASFSKYDIRVVATEFSPIGSDALATTVNMQELKVSPSGLSVLPIPTNSSMTSSTIYKATLRLYSNGQVKHTSVGVFYYDTRSFTVDAIAVSSKPNPNYLSTTDTFPYFSHSTPVIKAAGVALELTDPLFNYVKFNNVSMSCTNISPVTDVSFNATTEYYLGEQEYEPAHTYKWILKDASPPLPGDSAYELWGHIQLARSNSFPALPETVNAPHFTFGLEIVAADSTVGYHLVDPVVTMTFGDVVGTVSDQPIKITLTNLTDYNFYPFQSVTLNIRESNDLSTPAICSIDKQMSDFGTGANSNLVAITSADLSGYVNDEDTTDPKVNLVNGQQYYFEFILNFDDADLYKPTQERSVVKIGQFDDSLNAITAANVVNSWQLNPLVKDNGLVVSFSKTDQFLGTRNVPYNLDMFGTTTVLAEYSVAVDSSGNWTTWLPLTGGSITQQANPDYGLDAFNTDGRYTVPKYYVDGAVGAAQPTVKIYAVIPGQANYNLVKIRLTLITDDNSSYSNTTSSIFYVAQQTGYEYDLHALPTLRDKIAALTSDSAKQLARPSFRCFPKAPVHNFVTDVPFITAINGNNPLIIADVPNEYVADFSVPVSVPPYFKAVVTTDPSGNDFGSAAPYYYNGTLPNDNNHDVTGLKYPISFDGATFELSVKYVYTENPNIETDVTDKTIQQQGLLPITDPSANVVNSWQLNPLVEDDGLVVSFKKTAQFMGNSTASYNLDAAVNQATVLAQYSITHNGNDWTNWLPLTGGSIQQGGVNYALDPSNTDGRYTVPKYYVDGDVGAAQPTVKIYAVIPGQANYNLVKVRLTLSTDSSEYTPGIGMNAAVTADPVPIGTSETYDVAPVSTATYPIDDASVRYFPQADVHSFANPYEPKIGSVDASGNVHFIVPVHVPPYFSSSVTTSGGTVNGTENETVVSNSGTSYATGNVIGLSYLPTAASTTTTTTTTALTAPPSSPGDIIRFGVPVYNEDEGLLQQPIMVDVPVSDGELVLSYGPNADGSETVVAIYPPGSGFSAQNPHQTALSGLQPSTMYYVTLSPSNGQGLAYFYTFTTSPAPTTTTTTTTILGSFQLTVAYTSNENTAIYTDNVSMTVQMQGLPSDSFTVTASGWSRLSQQFAYTLATTATSTTADRMDGWNMYIKRNGDHDSTYSSYGNLLLGAGLSQTTSLSPSYDDYTKLDVKFVATRSIYLASNETANQVEGVAGANSDIEIVNIVKLPETLPAPTATDITLANLVYNTLIPTTTSQSGTLTVAPAANVAQITITAPDSSTHTSSSPSASLVLLIALTSTSTPLSYSVTYDYNQYHNNVIEKLKSAPVTVTFTTGTSTRNAPVLTAKTLLANDSFDLSYTSSNTGTLTGTTMTSIAYVKPANDVAVALDASGNVAVYQGSEVVLYVTDTFKTDYVAATISKKTANQYIQSPNSADFILAANPKIDEESIVVLKSSTQNLVRFSVNNNGAPVLNQVVLAVAQDSSDSENDPGFYALCIFTADNGFVADTVVSDTLDLGGINTTYTLAISIIPGTGMDTVTNFEFASSSPFATTIPVNIVIYVKSNTDGADSASFGNIPLTDGRLQIVNGTVKYTGDYIPTPLPITSNGTNYLVVPDNYKEILYENASTGQVTYQGITYPFNNLVTTLITTMGGLFVNSAFNQSISSWDTSNVTSMNTMFYNSAFNQSISSWNTSNVTDMTSMFGNSQFNQPINTNGNSWNTSNVTNMNAMFSNSAFNQSISSWNTSNVTSMNAMFYNSAFNQPIHTIGNSWNTSNVTDMTSMFGNSQFNQPIGNWNTSNVTSMNGMFYGAAFNQYIVGWNVTNVTPKPPSEFNGGGSALTSANSPVW